MTDLGPSPNGQLTGQLVVDERGADIGVVADVLYDDDPSQPSWLVIDCGRMRGEHYVPAAGSFTTADGDLVVPFQKKWVNSAPKAGPDRSLTNDLRRQLHIHYG